jgi:hypothetical protein
VNVEQEDIDLMAKLFDYAVLSAEQERISPAADSTPRHGLETSDLASSDLVPRSIISTSNDSAVIETRPIRADPLATAVSEGLDWPNEDFGIFPDIANDWSFFGRPWSTHFSEDST